MNIEACVDEIMNRLAGCFHELWDRENDAQLHESIYKIVERYYLEEA